MVYNEKLVAVIKCNGRILREHKDVVYLPFGSEYSVLLKNLNSKDALVNVEIDGREVISNLIVRANSEVEVERFFEGSMNEGHKLKFIEKNDDIREFRGDKIDDGIVRVEYQFEAKLKTFDCNPWKEKEIHHHHYHKYPDWRNTFIGSSGGTGEWSYSNDYSYNHSLNTVNSETYNTVTLRSCNTQNEDGITVEGNQSNQSFVEGNIGLLEAEKHVITLKLKGKTSDNTDIQRPLEVKSKVQCKYCGKKSKSDKRFCSNCGAALI